MDELRKTENHRLYNEYLYDVDNTDVLAIGTAGTGKTFNAIKAAIDWISKSPTHKFVGVRPTSAEELGYLPGDVGEKLSPWARPFRQNFEKNGMDDGYQSRMEISGRIEYMPLSLVGGVTMDDTFIHLDECQGATIKQIKSLLTRSGRNSKLVMTGDIDQISELFMNSGLDEFTKMVRVLNVPCHIIEFCSGDILRSEKCKRWIMAFDKWEQIKMEDKSWR